MFFILYRFLRIWSHFLEKSLIENFIFCAVLFKNWLPHSFNNGLHWQKKLNKTILFYLDKKGFYSFCFSQQKLKLGRIQFLKNNLIPANRSGLQSFLLETPTSDNQFFCLLVEKYFSMKIFIPTSGDRFQQQWK